MRSPQASSRPVSTGFYKADCDRETARTFGDCAPSNRQEVCDTADFLEEGPLNQEDTCGVMPIDY